MRGTTAWLVLVCAGCGRIGFGAASDASGLDDTAPDAERVCGAFGAPAPLSELNSTNDEWGTWMSNDRLTVYFTSDRGGNYNIFRATRTDPLGAFGMPTAVSELNTGVTDDDPFPTPDQLTIYLSSYRGGDNDVYMATRASVATQFSPPTAVTALNTSADDGAAVVSTDGRFLYLTSTRGGGAGGTDIYRATRAQLTDPFGPPVLEAISTAANECCFRLGADQRHAYYASGPTLSRQIMIADRDPVTGVVSSPVAFTPTASSSADHDPFAGGDELLGFSSNRPGGKGGWDLWAVQRTCQ